jgi:hypothetical protein
MAVEDGRAGFYTDVWGDENREPRAINAVNLGSGVSTEIVGHELHGELAHVEADLEAIRPQVPLAEATVVSRIQDLEADEHAQADLSQRCRLEGLTTPDHRLRRLLIELTLLALLGDGDVYFSSLAFQVFGLSDRRLVSFLPISELQAVAASVIVAMLIAVGIAGPRLTRFWHLLERAPSDDQAVDRRRARLAAEVFFVLVCIGGALSTLVGVSGVRAAYLHAQGVAAHWGEFFLIQLGIAIAGLMLIAWLSHPYDREWRSTTHAVNRSASELARAYLVLTRLVGRFNGLLRSRDAIMAQALAHLLAITNHARQQDELYARRVQHGEPEPTTTRLLPDDLPQPSQPRLVSELTRHLAGKPSMFKAYKPLDLCRVESRLHEVAERRAERGQSVNDQILDLIKNSHGASSEEAAANGRSNRKRPGKR